MMIRTDDDPHTCFVAASDGGRSADSGGSKIVIGGGTVGDEDAVGAG